MLSVLVNQSVATRRRILFQLWAASDGYTPALAEVGGQPQISVDGGAWTNVGIGTLVAIGHGRYYADLNQSSVSTVGSLIASRYASAATREAEGTSVRVVAFDQDTAAQTLLLSINASVGNGQLVFAPSPVIYLPKGTDLSVPFQINGTDGLGKDLTGATLQFTVTFEGVLTVKTIGRGITLLDQVNYPGQFTVDFVPSDTNSPKVRTRRYDYDLRVKFPDAKQYVPVQSTLEVTPVIGSVL